MRKEIVREVLNEISENRQREDAKALERQNELEKSLPGFADVIREQSQIGISFVREVMKGRNAREVAAEFEELSNKLERKKAELLAEIGKTPEYLEPNYACKICNDKARVDGKLCECVEKKVAKKTYESLNKQSDLALSSFDTFQLDYYSKSQDTDTGLIPYDKMRENLIYCKKYASQISLHSKNVLMIGATGLGKTHLSLSIAREAINNGLSVIYGSAPNLIETIEREKFGRGGENSGYTLNLLLDSELLILDDLGTEFQTKFTMSVIYNIINTRMNRGLPTIISTNLSFRELENHYTPRILSRITGSFDTLFFVGDDVRVKKQTEEY